ncbi:MAG: hypothetical protein ABI600_12645 [Luteolibacter sp.]
MATVTELIENALALSLTDRSYVASKLIESLDQEELSPEGIREYDQRVERWKSGQSSSTASDEMDAKVQSILNR